MDWLTHNSKTTRENNTVVVNVRDRVALFAAVRQNLSAGTGFSIATLNLDHVVKLRQRAAFRDAYSRHTLITADGNPIVWLARLAGQKVSLVPGSELVEPVAQIAAAVGAPVLFFGSSSDSLAEAERRLTAAHPALKVVARISPPMGFNPHNEEGAAAIEQLRRSGAQLVFVALGAPKQEEFVARAQKVLPNAGFLSIGAGLDFVSGSQTRAPKLVRGLAGEWLWRLMLSPSRLTGRYLNCAVLVPSLAFRAIRTRFGLGRRFRDRSKVSARV